MNTSISIAVTWFGQEHRVLGLDWNYLVIIGLIGNATFSMRLVLEYRRQRHHVFLFYFPARSGWHSRLSAELDHLRSQFDADS